MKNQGQIALFIFLSFCILILIESDWMKSQSMNIQMKAIEQYVQAVLLLFQLFLSEFFRIVVKFILWW